MAIAFLPRLGLAQSTIEAIQAQINALMAQLTQLQNQLSQAQGQATVWCHDFNTNLKVGDAGSEIGNLITVLKKDGFEIDNLGQGDLASATLDESIASAISGFQQKYADEILKPVGLRYGTGYVGKLTRAKLNQLYGCVIKPKLQPIPCPAYAVPSSDFCVGGKIVYPEKDENACFRPPKCILPITNNQPPVIHGVGGPTTLDVGGIGTWVIKAYDPENGPLTYDVAWGDTFGSGYAPQTANLPSQTATFTHSYSSAGTYNPVFTVTDSKGLSAKTSISVNVGLTPQTVSEQVKCLFRDSTNVQECYSSANVGCKDTSACVVDVKAAKGEQITWKSTCGGYAYTTMDGNNEYAEFKCVASTIPPTPASSITVLSPNGGEVWQIGKTYTIVWYSNNVVRDDLSYGKTSRIDLVDIAQGSAVVSGIGTAGAGLVQAANNISWTIPSNIPVGATYKIRVSTVGSDGNTADLRIFDVSDAPLSIAAADTSSITVLSPNGGEQWQKGTTQTIKWDSTNVSAVYIKLRKGSDTYSGSEGLVTNTIPNVGYYQWVVPTTLPDGTDYAIRIVDGNGVVIDDSNALFSIVATVSQSQNISPKITGGSSLPPTTIQPGQVVNFNWNAQDDNKDNLAWSVNWGDGTGMASTCPSVNVSSGQGWNLNTSYTWKQAGIYTVKVAVSDCKGGTDSQTVTVAVGTITTPSIPSTYPASSLNIIYPNGGEVWTKGMTYTVKWSANGLFSQGSKRVILEKSGVSVLQYSGNVDNADLFNLTLYSSDIIPGNDYKIKVEFVDINGKAIASDTSDNYFSIVASGTTSRTDTVSQMANTLESARLILIQMLESLKNQ